MGSLDTLKFGVVLLSLIVTILLSKQLKFKLDGLKLKHSGSQRNVNGRFFAIDFVENTFLKDNEPFQYISGSIHYSRVPEIYWYDRLLKMKAAGLNTVQVYVPWNFHEFTEGIYDFSGNKNLHKFLTIAESLDLLVLLRSGPYMCGEWDFGGLPAWLLKKNPQMKIRSSAPDYMLAVSRWYSALLPILKLHLYQNNGSIIMVQIENEYGSFPSCDNEYLRQLYDIVRSYLGNDVIIYSTDGNGLSYLVCGSSDRRIFSTVDFGPGGAMNPTSAFSALEEFQPRGPLVNSEYYSGWLDSWGRVHNSVRTADVVNGLKSLYAFSKSVNVNMYMFHGGTSFGFWNGANALPYLPQVTSYDYDAPLSEAGDTTLKYMKIREYIQSINPNIPLPPIPSNSTKGVYGPFFLQQNMDFLPNVISQSVQTFTYPITMEMLNRFQGLMVYVTNTQTFQYKKGSTNDNTSVVQFSRIGDYAYIFTGNEDNTEILYQGTLDRNMAKLTLNIKVDANLIVLVENSGHINFGPYMVNDLKGIIGNVSLNNVVLENWKHFPIDLFNHTAMSKYRLNKTKSMPTQAGLFTTSFTITDFPLDTFARLPFFGKGFLFVNGFNLGRYWNTKGPQLTLYTPKSVLRSGLNSVTVLELEGVHCTVNCYIEFIPYPILDGPVHA